MSFFLMVLVIILGLSIYLNMGFGLYKFGNLTLRDTAFGKFFFTEDVRSAWALIWPLLILTTFVIAIIYAMAWIIVRLFMIVRSIALARRMGDFLKETIGYLFLGKLWQK